jgi:hypothetical protein
MRSSCNPPANGSESAPEAGAPEADGGSVTTILKDLSLEEIRAGIAVIYEWRASERSEFELLADLYVFFSEIRESR